MVNAAKSTRQNRTLTIDFHDETTYFLRIDTLNRKPLENQ
jgi:hypothetical protein